MTLSCLSDSQLQYQESDMGKFKDKINKFMRPNISKAKENGDAMASVTASKSLTDSAEQEPVSLAKQYRSVQHFAYTAGEPTYKAVVFASHVLQCYRNCTSVQRAHAPSSMAVAGRHQQLPGSQRAYHQDLPSMGVFCIQNTSCLLSGLPSVRSRTPHCNLMQPPTTWVISHRHTYSHSCSHSHSHIHSAQAAHTWVTSYSHTTCARAALTNMQHLLTVQTTSPSPPPVSTWNTAPLRTPQNCTLPPDTPCQMASRLPLRQAAAALLVPPCCFQQMAASSLFPTLLQVSHVYCVQ